MSAIVKHMPYPVHLDGAIKKTFINTIFATDDNLSHSFDIALHRDNEKVTIPDGATVTGYFIRYSDNATVMLDGTASGNVVSVALTRACYNKPGQFALVIKVTADGIISTVFYGEGTIYISSTDIIVDEEHIIPSLEDLLAQIADMERVTADANTATDNANTAAQNANTAAGRIDGLTVSAMDGDAVDAQITEEEGGYHIGFTLRRGEQGNDGITPHIGDNGNWFVGDSDTGVKAQGPAGQNGTGSGTVTSVNGIEPDQTGNVDLGELSGGTVTSVNGIEPDETGNIDLGELGGTVTSVNGVAPDENGNVDLGELGGTVTSVNGIEPDETGNVDLGELSSGTVTSVNGIEPDETGNVDLGGMVTSVNGIEPDENGNVHLGELGGAASYAYNLLDNSDFTNPVNQRGAASYNAKGYAIDRWKIASDGMTVEPIAGSGVKLTNTGTSGRIGFTQILPENYIGKTLTAAVCDADTGNVYCASATVPPIGTAVQMFCVVDFNNHTLRLELSKGGVFTWTLMIANNSTLKIRWAALYEGEYTADTLPPYVCKGYAAELVECMRYYQIVKLERPHAALSGNNIDMGFALSIPFRIKPTFTLVTAPTWVRAGGNQYNISNAVIASTAYTEGSCAVFVRISNDNTLANSHSGAADGIHLTLSADL